METKKSKKKLIIVLSIILGVIFVVIPLAIYLVLFNPMNDIELATMEDRFTDSIENMGIEVIESETACGKLNGNGNGMNFFCAALVKCDSVEAAEAIVNDLDAEFEITGYCPAVDALVDYDDTTLLEHSSLAFDKLPSDTNGCYYIYFYESTAGSDRDIRAH